MGLADNRIPEDKLPQCWSDDVRMNALFAPFRLKSANPESWEMKMKFWSDMLRQWCRHKNDPIVSAADARAAFQRKGRSPACLEIVIEELYNKENLTPVSKYHQILHNGPEGWIRWGARLAFKPAALAFTAVSFLMPTKKSLDNDGLPKATIDSTQRFVLESAVEEQATQLIQNFPPGCERVGTIEELMRRCDWTGSREVFELLLGWLVGQGRAVKQGDVVKLAPSASSLAGAVTAADAAAARLQAAAARLREEGERLARQIDRAALDARAAAKLGDRSAAKNHLRRKHKLCERAEKCEAALDNVNHLLLTMRDMEVNSAVVDTYRMSAQAMKEGMKESGLNEDAVHDTMDDLKDVLETYNEVERALASSPLEEADAAELEQELQLILASGPPAAASAAAAGTTPIHDLPNLPSPPKNAPSSRKISERDFVFDGEARVLAELNDLDVEERPRGEGEGRGTVVGARGGEAGGKGEPSADVWAKRQEAAPAPSKSWYPPQSEFALDNSLDNLCRGLAELRTDQRLHPGQKLDVDYKNTAPLYNTEFQVNDHTLTDGVWLFNCRDDNHNSSAGLASSTDYNSPESPGKWTGAFQMAPGGERKPSNPWSNS